MIDGVRAPRRTELAITLTAALAVIVSPAVAPASRVTHRLRGAHGSRGAPATRVTPLYRPVGCVRRGPSVAYTHGPRRRVVALSFDDGPWPDTPAFVRLLEREHVPATFFLIGGQVTDRYRSLLRRELRDGDALGDHTFTHPYLTRTGDVRGQLQRTITAIRAQTNFTPCVFRPPYGAYSGSVVATARALHMATVLWNVDPRDYTRPGVGAIASRVLAQVHPGSIVLSHDGGGPREQTLAAYGHIIRVLRARGYRFVTVPQLLGFHNVYERCRRTCLGEGIHGPLPRGSVLRHRPAR